MTPWQELGIPPTSDPTEVRRAYAARLRQTRPEDDRDAFLRLRAAYEAALALFAVVPWEESPAVPDAKPGVRLRNYGDESSAPAGEVNADNTAMPVEGENGAASGISVRNVVLGAIKRRDLAAAADTLAQAIDANFLPLGEQMTLCDALLLALVNENTLPAVQRLVIAERFGWRSTNTSDTLNDRAILKELNERIDAEKWLARLKADADSYWRFLNFSASARLMLGRGHLFFSRVFPPEPPLSQNLAALDLHYPWVGHAFEQTRIADLREAVRRRCITCSVLLAWVVVATLLSWVSGIPGFYLVMATWFVAYRHPDPDIARMGVLAFVIPSIIGVLTFEIVDASFENPRTLEMWAATGNADAQAKLGIDYARSDGDDAARQAALWLRKAADQGHARAQCELSALYVYGRGVPKDDAEALSWLQKSGEAYPHCVAMRGFLLEHGQGVVRDHAEARRLYLLAATRGDTWAQVELARVYRDGVGGPADPATAFKWALQAALAGDPGAMNDVGYAYLIGHGVGQDPHRAFPWLRAAAEAGQPNAMQTLAWMYLEGTATRRDVDSAYRWLMLANRMHDRFGVNVASAREALARAASLLDTERRATIDEELRAWRPGPGTPPIETSNRPIATPP